MSPAASDRDGGSTGNRRSAGKADRRPAEERAEEVMERVASDVSRFVTRFAGRAREEVEDIVAEARTVKERWNSSRER
jgi:hypothetical protein